MQTRRIPDSAARSPILAISSAGSGTRRDVGDAGESMSRGEMLGERAARGRSGPEYPGLVGPSPYHGCPVARTLIIVPALNEEESLPATLKELREVADGHDVVVIDDGSTDATADIARRAGAVATQLPFTLGVGGAVRVGMHYAQRNGYDRAVVIDADGQHDPAGITALLDALDAGADMAVGSRFADSTGRVPGRPHPPAGHEVSCVDRPRRSPASAIPTSRRGSVRTTARSSSSSRASTRSSTSPTRSRRSSSFAMPGSASTRWRSRCGPVPPACRRRGA